MFKSCIAGLAVVAAFAFLAPSSTAQDLDGLWFQTTVSAKGYRYGEGIDGAKKAGVKLHAYILFTSTGSDGSGPAYNFEVWMETSPDTWEMTYESSVTADGPDLFFRDWFLEFDAGEGTSVVCGYGVERITVKTDKEGNVKSAKISTLGREAVGTTTDGTDEFTGSAKLKMKSVPEEKLPFTPMVKKPV